MMFTRRKKVVGRFCAAACLGCVGLATHAEPGSDKLVHNFDYHWDFDAGPAIGGDPLGFDLYNNTTGAAGADGVADFLLNSGAGVTFENGVVSVPTGANVVAQLWPVAPGIHGTTGYTTQYRVRAADTSGAGVSLYASPNGTDSVGGVSLLNNGGTTNIYHGITTAGQPAALRAGVAADQFVDIRIAAEYAPGQPGNHRYSLYVDGKRAGTDLNQSIAIANLDRLVFGDLGSAHSGRLELDELGFTAGAYHPGLTYHDSVTAFSFDRDSGNPQPGADGNLFNVRTANINGTPTGVFRTSADDGQTWVTRGVMQTHTGQDGDVVGGMTRQIDEDSYIHVFREADSYSPAWDHTNHVPLASASFDMWSIRSDDGGATWTDHQKMFDGYVGAFINMTVTDGGTVIAPLGAFDTQGGRGVIRTLYSDDKGATWSEGNTLDLADAGVYAYGSEDGVLEPTVAQRADGSLLLLMRTTQGYFWQATSDDEGRTWENFEQTDIEASNSPGTLVALDNGRLAMIYNQYTPEFLDNFDGFGRDDIDYAPHNASIFREEMSIIYSDDGGDTWTDPLVFAANIGGRLQYAELFERHPGELWMRVGGEWLETQAPRVVIPEPATLGLFGVLGFACGCPRRPRRSQGPVPAS